MRVEYQLNLFELLVLSLAPPIFNLRSRGLFGVMGLAVWLTGLLRIGAGCLFVVSGIEMALRDSLWPPLVFAGLIAAKLMLIGRALQLSRGFGAWLFGLVPQASVVVDHRGIDYFEGQHKEWISWDHVTNWHTAPGLLKVDVGWCRIVLPKRAFEREAWAKMIECLQGRQVIQETQKA